MLRVGVAGAGAMGSGIAQLLAQSGLETVLYDISGEVLRAAQRRITVGLKRARKADAAALVIKTTSLREFDSCDAVIEAVPEDLELKRGLFALLPARAILASNTSGLSVSRLAQAAKDPARVAGMHFFNPAPVMRLVEVVKAERTSEETASFLLALAQRLGKTAVLCQDTPGFIVNRVGCPFFQTAARLLEAGAGTPADIDRALKKAGFPLGAFELADLIGLDVSLAVQRSLHEALGRPQRLAPVAGVAALIARGCLGRKSGKGFFVNGEENPALRECFPRSGSAPKPPEEIAVEVWDAVRAEARLAVDEGVAAPEVIDLAMQLGMNWPKGRVSS